VILARLFVIGGRVQGVGFRFFAEDAARREGLHGYVRNLPDGSVEAEVEGDREAVERFERAIRRGPAGGRVDTVAVTILTPSGRAGGFEIRP
jgi:acylphosphatase